MERRYVISEFARLRRDEIAEVPEPLMIDPGYLEGTTYDVLAGALREVRGKLYRMYENIAEVPELFGLSTYDTSMPLGGKDYNEARTDCDLPAYLLLYLFSSGRLEGDTFIVDTAGFRAANKGTRAVRRVHEILPALAGYGLKFAGLNEGWRLPRGGGSFTITCPDNPAVLCALHVMAAKCHRFIELGGFARFRTWNLRVLAEPADVMTVGLAGDHVGDSAHDSSERAFTEAFDAAMRERGHFCRVGAWHEGPFARYYESERSDTYLYEVMLERGAVSLRLRIRDAGACMEYLSDCPDEIRALFRPTDAGCEARKSGSCKSSTRYLFEGEEKWRCGCWRAAFPAPPEVANIPHYIRLVELGKKRAKAYK